MADSGTGSKHSRHHFPKKWIFFGVFILLVFASNAVRHYCPLTPGIRAGQQTVSVVEYDVSDDRGATPTGDTVKIAYRELLPANFSAGATPTVLLFHGTPGDSRMLLPLAKKLAEKYRVLLPDLPGAGTSQRNIVDYSVEANAAAMADFSEKLNAGKVHLLGYGQGGAVAINFAHKHPESTRSMSLVSSVGSQEFEMLGNRLVNKIVLGFHLFFVKIAEDVIPHFGLLDMTSINIPYARGLWDSDFSEIKYYVSEYKGPLLLAHTESDPFVSPDTARYTAQLAPQAETFFTSGGHGSLIDAPEALAEKVFAFIDKADAGTATVRTTPPPARDKLPSAPPAEGLRLWMLMLMIIVCAMVAEDPTCLAAGLLVSQGVLSFTAATVACLISILIGDFSLYLIGRVLGRPALRKAPLKWIIAEYEIDRMAGWFEKKGFQGLFLIITSRFIPASRLPTFICAGIMRLSLWRLSILFFIAAASWTPLLIWLAEKIGPSVIERFEHWKHNAMWIAVGLLISVWVLMHVVVPALTWRGRRHLVMKLRRWSRHEYWPTWMLYVPLLAYWFWEGVRRFSFVGLTAANPGLGRQGGFTGESKDVMFGALPASAPVSPWQFIPALAEMPANERVSLAKKFIAEKQLHWPVVLKPDLGDDGFGVNVIQNEAQLEEWLTVFADDAVLQAYAAGEEFEVVWSRLPGETRGRILAVTEKRIPTVCGDGHRTLEDLIWADDRAVAMGKLYLRLNWRRAGETIPAGESVALCSVGTHACGAQVVDRQELRTEALARALDGIAEGVPDGLHFAVYDLRTESAAALGAGNFSAITGISGGGSVSSRLYDQYVRLGYALSSARRQMRLAFVAADVMRAAGRKPGSLWSMLASWGEARGRTIIDLRQ